MNRCCGVFLRVILFVSIVYRKLTSKAEDPKLSAAEKKSLLDPVAADQESESVMSLHVEVCSGKIEKELIQTLQRLQKVLQSPPQPQLPSFGEAPRPVFQTRAKVRGDYSKPKSLEE